MYLIFLAINVAVAVPFCRDWRRALIVPDRNFRWVSAVIVLTLCTLTWLFVMYWTVSCWVQSLSPSSPKPHFLIIWVISMFVLGLVASLRMLPAFRLPTDDGSRQDTFNAQATMTGQDGSSRT